MLAPLSQDNRGTVFYYGVQHIGDDQSISILVIHQRRINLVNRWPLFILKGLGECKPSCTNNCFEIELRIPMGLITKNSVLDGERVIAFIMLKKILSPAHILSINYIPLIMRLFLDVLHQRRSFTENCFPIIIRIPGVY